MSVDQISLEDLFFYELLPVPKPMFTVTAERRFPKNKAVLKNEDNWRQLKRTARIDVIIVDGCVALQHVHWPKDKKIWNFVDSFVLYISELLSSAAVYLIFDRYIIDYSIKEQTRLKRLGQYLHSHVLT